MENWLFLDKSAVLNLDCQLGQWLRKFNLV